MFLEYFKTSKIFFGVVFILHVSHLIDGNCLCTHGFRELLNGLKVDMYLLLNKSGSIFVSRGKPQERGCVRVAKIGPDLM